MASEAWFYGPVTYLIEYGDTAVMAFWSISGFIFAHVYSQRPAVSGWSFFTHRFSRLYPLHFITLLYVAGLQIGALTGYGSGVIPAGTNDAWHFMLQLLLISGWGLGDTLSFNLPIWSVSVEIVSYAAFWWLLRTLGIGYRSVLVALTVCVLVWALTKSPIATCAAYFFLSVGAWLVLRTLETMSPRRRSLCATAAALCAVTPLLFTVVTGRQLPQALILAPICSATLVVLALLEHRARFDLSWLGPVGDITYSTYLTHMPLQMTFVLLMLAGVASPMWLLNPVAPVIYVALVIVVGHFCFRYFERPAQNYLRRRFEELDHRTEVVASRG